MDIDTGKSSTSGFVVLDVPQSMKVDSSNASVMGSISDYYHSISSGWDLGSYLRSLAKVLKGLQVGSGLAGNTKEGTNSPCTVSEIFLFYLSSCFLFGYCQPLP